MNILHKMAMMLKGDVTIVGNNILYIVEGFIFIQMEADEAMAEVGILLTKVVGYVL